MAPLVSVVLPVRNGGVYLEAAVSSILGQSLPDIELIIVDDQSTDAALVKLDRGDRRMSVIPSTGQGVSQAFNTGMLNARGPFVARMDADDISLPDRLKQQIAYLEQHSDVDICGGCVEIFSETAIRGGNLRYQDWLNSCRDPESIHRELFVESPIPNPTALFRRGALDRLGGYADPGWPEDYDLFLRADALGMKMGKPEQTVLRWREHEDRLTRTDERYAIRMFQTAKAHYLVRHRLVQGAPLVIWGAGPSGRLFHDLLAAEDVFISGFLEVHPRRIGGEKRGLPVWPLEQIARMPEAFVLVAVGAAGARAEIRQFMLERGRVEGEQFMFVA